MHQAKPLEIYQRDGRTIIVGPIPETDAKDSPPYDASAPGHTTTLVLKKPYADDAEGTTIVGVLSLTDGWWFSHFQLPATATQIAGDHWLHAWITPPGADPITLGTWVLDIKPT